MPTASRFRLAVWGDPIAHSRSPELHAAAYRVLGLEWEYGRQRVDAGGFDRALDELDGEWRGLSLTMPLKERAWRAAYVRDRRAELTGAVNTLLLSDDGPIGFNTDVGGIVRALAECGITAPLRTRVIGAGATAASTLVALAECGTEHVDVVVRAPVRAEGLRPLAEALGLRLAVHSLDDAPPAVDLTISTLPGAAPVAAETALRLASEGGRLFDVAYAPWPSTLATAWADAGRRADSGQWMLLHQAVLQVRIFVSGSPEQPLEAEDDVVASMRSVLVGD